MNLAEASALLGKKENEKNAVFDEIESLEGLKNEGTVAILNCSVLEVSELPEGASRTFGYQLRQENPEVTIDVSDQDLEATASINLSAKGGKLIISCTVVQLDASVVSVDTSSMDQSAVGSQLVYSSEIGVDEIPEDGELRCDIVATANEADASPSELTLKLKASVDDMEKVISSKQLEFDQVQQEFREAVVQVRQAKERQVATSKDKKKSSKTISGKKTAGGGSKPGTTTGTGSRGESTTSSGDADSNGEGYPVARTAGGMLGAAAGAILVTGQWVFDNRNYFLFGAAALGIHFYGDYASV